VGTWRFLLILNFFGLTDKYSENVYEQFFFLKYHGGWSLTESYNLPVGLRNWFMKRLIKQKEDEKEAIEEARNGTKGGRGGSQGLTADNQPPPPQGYNFDT
jgi:outer membrane receptor for ferrienterochelin and colicin